MMKWGYRVHVQSARHKVQPQVQWIMGNKEQGQTARGNAGTDTWRFSATETGARSSTGNIPM